MDLLHCMPETPVSVQTQTEWKQNIGLSIKQYHKTQEGYKLFIIKAILTQCEYLAVIYWKTQKMATPLGRTLELFLTPSFSLAA